jgi:2-haloacid dehalogenase
MAPVLHRQAILPIICSPMKGYRGFLLDADNTIFDYDRAEAEALDETLAEAAPAAPRGEAKAAYRAINAGYWKRFEQGTISLDALKVGRFADLLSALSVAGDPNAVSAAYLGRLASKAYFLPNARETLDALSRRSLLCLVTNGIAMVQRGRLAAAGVEGCFAAIMISEELGFAKPDPRFFAAAAAALGLPPADLLCVGDSPASDVAGARAAGIDACWYAPGAPAWPGPGEPPLLVVRDLAELLAFAPTV